MELARLDSSHTHHLLLIQGSYERKNLLLSCVIKREKEAPRKSTSLSQECPQKALLGRGGRCTHLRTNQNKPQRELHLSLLQAVPMPLLTITYTRCPSFKSQGKCHFFIYSYQTFPRPLTPLEVFSSYSTLLMALI